jgi:antigen flippase
MSEARLEGSGKATSQIVRSTAIIGVSNAFVTLTRIARTKAFAILLGPAGIGLVGLYTSILATAAAVGGMGVGSSGVRQIAEANDDPRRLAGTLFALRAITIVLGTAGAVSVVILSKALSRWTLGNQDYATPIVILAAGVLFQVISDSQTAVLNGLRRVGDLARISIVGSVIGTVFAIVIVWLKGIAALPYAVVLPVLIGLACSWYVIGRLRLARRRPPWKELKVQARSLLTLGVTFMLVGLMMTGALLVTRIIFADRLGLAATGHFQAAWGLAVVNVDFILNAMGVDFYPNLTTSITRDQAAGNSLVNQQTEVALLLGGPLIIGMLTVASPLIRLFYTGDFTLAAGLLRWLLLGSILKLVSWPLGYLIMAHGWARASLLAELAWCALYVGLIYAGVPHFGVVSAGYAFVVAYLVYMMAVYLITHTFGGFLWTHTNLRLASVLVALGILVMALEATYPIFAFATGGVITVALGIFSLRRLCTMVDNPTAKRIAVLMRAGK